MKPDQQPVVFVPGPPHPDLFGGLTPTTLAVPLQESLSLYEMCVRETTAKRFDVIAATREEAKNIALYRVGGRWLSYSDTEWSAEVWCESPVEPTYEQVNQYLEEVAHARYV